MKPLSSHLANSSLSSSVVSADGPSSLPETPHLSGTTGAPDSVMTHLAQSLSPSNPPPPNLCVKGENKQLCTCRHSSEFWENSELEPASWAPVWRRDVPCFRGKGVNFSQSLERAAGPEGGRSIDSVGQPSPSPSSSGSLLPLQVSHPPGQGNLVPESPSEKAPGSHGTVS